MRWVVALGSPSGWEPAEAEAWTECFLRSRKTSWTEVWVTERLEEQIQEFWFIGVEMLVSGQQKGL